jgi:hypothetical protein
MLASIRRPHTPKHQRTVRVDVDVVHPHADLLTATIDACRLTSGDTILM